MSTIGAAQSGRPNGRPVAPVPPALADGIRPLNSVCAGGSD